MDTPVKYCPRIFCVGRNYAEHIQELNNAVPAEPVIFIKPLTSLGDNKPIIQYPAHGKQLQHEVEVVIKIGQSGRPTSSEQCRAFISAITLGLDLTLRDVQQDLKHKGLPWEKAKAFDDSARVGLWQPMNDDIDLSDITFSCRVNTTLRQESNTAKMLNPIIDLVQFIGSIWQFVPGDIIFTGTPQGVGDLAVGDEINVLSETLGVNQSFLIQK